MSFLKRSFIVPEAETKLEFRYAFGINSELTKTRDSAFDAQRLNERLYRSRRGVPPTTDYVCNEAGDVRRSHRCSRDGVRCAVAPDPRTGDALTRREDVNDGAIVAERRALVCDRRRTDSDRRRCTCGTDVCRVLVFVTGCDGDVDASLCELEWGRGRN